MKRRDFISSAGAAAVLPVLPPILCGPAVAAPTAIAPINAAQIGWAALFARANNHASAAMIQKWMGVDLAQAQTLMSELTSRNIISAPVAGSATAVQPMYSSSCIPAVTKTTTKVMQHAKDVFDKLADADGDPIDAPTAEMSHNTDWPNDDRLADTS